MINCATHFDPAYALFVNKAIHHEARALIASYRYSFGISFAARSIFVTTH